MNGLAALLRNTFQKMCNRRTLTFLFFLLLSTAFWFMKALNEVAEDEIEVRVELRDIPRGVVVTSDIPPTIRVTVKDRGTTLLNYRYGEGTPTLVIDGSAMTGEDGRLRLTTADITRSLRASFSSTTSITGVRPEGLDIYYNHGASKRVAVRLAGLPTAAAGYAITSTRLTPDSITVIAARSSLDTLTALTVSGATLRDLSATTTADLTPTAASGARLSPATVRLQVNVDRLVEKKVSVSVRGINAPQGSTLRTFPSQTEVVCQVPMSYYRAISAADFDVVADYATLSADSTARCRLTLRKAPTAARHARITNDEVEYVLEKN